MIVSPQFTTGRKKIFCYETEINEHNVIDVVKRALITHNANVVEIDWLFQLYRGYDGSIDSRTRSGVNTDINSKAFVSYYSLIADYTANLFMQNQIIFVNVDGEEEVSEYLMEYNKIHRGNNKYARDKKAALHAAICGVGYRFVELNNGREIIKDSVLSPQSVMVLYGDDTDDVEVAKVYITQVLDEESQLIPDIAGQRANNIISTKNHYTVYAGGLIFDFEDGSDDVYVSESLHQGCPIIEYKMNPFYIGSFERVTSLINLLSVLRSDGVNGVIQSMAGIIFGKNIGLATPNADDTEEEIEEKAQINAELARQMKDYRQLFVNSSSKDSPASIEYIATEMYNADIEVLYQGIINDIVTISRIPNSTVNLGGSGNSGAADTASGVKQALENAKNAEPFWFESAREQLRLELEILHYQGLLKDLHSSDIELAMQRTISIDPIVATQAFTSLLQSGVKISDAADYVGITADPVAFEKRTLDNIKENEERKLEYARREKEINSETSQEINEDHGSTGSSEDS